MKRLLSLLKLFPDIAVLLLVLFGCGVSYAITVSNIHYEPSNERITVSCVDHKSPQVHVLNPASGTIVVVDCERQR